MIALLPAPDHVAAFRILDTLQGRDYDQMIPVLENKMKEHERVSVLADLSDMQDMTGHAMRRDAQYGLSKLSELHRFERAALVADKEWVKAAAELASFLFPQIDTRVFPKEEHDKAMGWVAGG